MPSSETNNEPTTSDVVSTNGGSDSELPIEDQRSSSVFDFLYHDVRRVGAFLAQFHEHGLLQQTKATEGVARSAASKTGIAGGLDVPLIGRGGGSLDTTTTDEERDSAEYTYDPLWRNARTLLDYLEERGLIERDLPKARIGRFVLVTGRLAMFDLGILKSAWSIPFIKDTAVAQALAQSAEAQSDKLHVGRSHGERKRLERARKDAVTKEWEGNLHMLSLLPHAVQASVRMGEFDVWSSLREEHLIVPASEMLLKHGTLIPGDWTMLGILDAVPDAIIPQLDEDPDAFVAHMLAVISLGALWQVIGFKSNWRVF